MQLSAVIGVPRAAAGIVAVQPPPVLMVSAEGHVIVGLILSRTVTFWVHVEVFPETSTAVHITTVVPIG